MQIDLDALERLADEERWRGNKTDGEHDKVRIAYRNATRPSAIYALIAKVRELEQDAARWRYLRDSGKSLLVARGNSELTYALTDMIASITWHATADAAIDAARGGEEHG